MAKLLKLRRGTTTQHGSFTGAEGEVTIDTTKDTAVVHDGSQAGGRPLAREDMNNVSSANILGRISNGDIVGTKLENSGVTAGSYGSSSAIPIVTVDAQGLVTAASTTAIDSTTIANGTSNVAVANNGDITTTRSGTARLVVDDAGVDVTGNITSTGSLTVDNNAIIKGANNSAGILELHSDRGDDNADKWRFIAESSGSELNVQNYSNGAWQNNLRTTGNAGVDLYHSNGIKASTTSSGLSVAGTITSTGNITVTNNSPTLNLTDSDHNSDYKLNVNAGLFQIRDATNDAYRIKIASDGTVDIGQNLNANGGIDVTGNVTVTGTVDGVDIAAFKTAFDEAFPSGTKMLFQQTSAPTGWTKVTSGVDNKALRVVSGAAGSGGTNQFSNTFASVGITANAGNATAGGNVTVANATVTGNVSIDSVSTSGNVNSHTLSSNEMPSHRHNLTRNNNSNYWNSRNNIAGFSGMPNYSYIQPGSQYSGSGGTAFYTDHTGGGGGHTHGFTGSSHTHSGTLSAAAHTHNASFTGSAHNHSISVNNIDLTVQYLDVIIASKD